MCANDQRCDILRVKEACVFWYNLIMNYYIVIIIFTVIIVIVGLVSSSHSHKKYQDEKYLDKLEKARLFLHEIDSFDDYVTWKQRDVILEKHKSTHSFFENKTKFYSKEPDVQRFNRIYEDFKTFIDNYNDEYVDRTIKENDAFFDDIEGKALDHQQREAVVTDEYSNLVVAGAGSGKTLTILGKVLFLTKIKHVKPERILLMSYTRKTVEDLNDRLKKISSNAKATTFHKLGLDIIVAHDGKRPEVANEGLLNKVVRRYLRDGISSHTDQVRALVEFIACYSNIPEDYNEFDSAGERFDYYKGSVDYDTLKSKVNNAKGVKATLAVIRLNRL